MLRGITDQCPANSEGAGPTIAEDTDSLRHRSPATATSLQSTCRLSQDTSDGVLSFCEGQSSCKSALTQLTSSSTNDKLIKTRADALEDHPNDDGYVFADDMERGCAGMLVSSSAGYSVEGTNQPAVSGREEAGVGCNLAHEYPTSFIGLCAWLIMSHMGSRSDS